MQSLISYLKQNGAISASIVKGPNGAFISASKADESKITIPVGKRSQAGKLEEFNILITDNGVAIATVNHYEVVESITL